MKTVWAAVRASGGKAHKQGKDTQAGGSAVGCGKEGVTSGAWWWAEGGPR